MNRTITITGVGKASIKPDQIVITLALETIDYEYEKTMQLATAAIATLNEAVHSAGFGKKDLKTTHFAIDTYYESYRDKNNDYKKRFSGYKCQHTLKLTFDYDAVQLSQVLTEMAKVEVYPELNIQFTVKDTRAVSEQLLVNATENARHKAEVLLRAAGAELGQLLNIDYSWKDIYFHSPTLYQRDSQIMMEATMPEIEPEDIAVQDSVSFVWEILNE